MTRHDANKNRTTTKFSARLVLPKKIIVDIQRKCARQSPKMIFTVEGLLEELQKFVEEYRGAENDKMKYWKNKFNNQSGGISSEALQDALSMRGKESGAAPPLRELLCYYTYGKGWTDSLNSLGLSEKKIIEESESIKKKKPPNFKEVFLIEIAENGTLINEKLDIILEKLFRDNNNDTNKNSIRIANLIDRGEYTKAESELKNYYDKNVDFVHSYSDKLSRNAYELALLMFYQGRYDQAIKYSDIVMEYTPKHNWGLIAYIKTASHTFKKEFIIASKFYKEIPSNTYFPTDSLLKALIDYYSGNEIEALLGYTAFHNNKKKLGYPQSISRHITKEKNNIISNLNRKYLFEHYYFFLYFLDSCIISAKDCEKALHLVNSALKYCPCNPLALEHRAKLIVVLDRKKIFISDLLKKINKTKNASALYEYALNFAVLSEKEQMLVALAKALEIDESLKIRVQEDFCFKNYKKDRKFKKIVGLK